MRDLFSIFSRAFLPKGEIKMAEPEYEPMQQRPLFPGEAPADGRGDELADLREEARHLARVRAAVGDYFATKRKRR